MKDSRPMKPSCEKPGGRREHSPPGPAKNLWEHYRRQDLTISPGVATKRGSGALHHSEGTMRIGICLSILLAVLLFWVPLSHAQHVHTVTTGVTLSGTYSDNISATAGDTRQFGFYSEIQPWLRYDREGKRGQLGLSYEPSFRYYFEDEDHFIGHRLNFTADHLLREHLTARFSNSFRVSQDPYDILEPGFIRIEEDLIIIEDPTLRTGRRTYYTNHLRPSLSYQFGPSNRLNLGYSFSFLINEDPQVEDNMRHRPDMSLEYWWNVKYGTVLSAAYTRGEFDDSPSLNEYRANARFLRRLTPNLNVFVEHGQTYVRYDQNNGGENGRRDYRDYEVFDANLGFDYQLTPSTFMAIRGGYFYQQESSRDSTSGFQVDGDMARQFQRGSLRISGGTGYDLAAFGAENLGFTKYYRGMVMGRYDFTRRCSGSAAFQYRRNTYEVEDREDDVYTLNTGLSYVFRPWLTGRISYVYRMTESTDPGQDYRENRVSVSLTATPTRIFRF